MLEQDKVSIEPKRNIEAYQALLELDEKERGLKSKQGYSKAYMLSLLFPPIGIYYFFKYLFFVGGSEEDIKAGFISLALTTFAIIVSIWLSVSLFKQVSPLSPSQSSDLLKEFITPENQKQMKSLFQ
ncbi:MAG: hypothetical protein AAB929_03275 [Patescibacteria group bacterium]